MSKKLSLKSRWWNLSKKLSLSITKHLKVKDNRISSWKLDKESTVGFNELDWWWENCELSFKSRKKTNQPLTRSNN